MPNLSEENKKALVDLKNAYQQVSDVSSPPDPLMIELDAMNDENPSLESAWRIYQAYSDNPPPQHPALLGALRELSTTALYASLKKTQEAGLLIGEQAQANFNAVAVHYLPGIVATALAKLHEGGLLTGKQAQANRNTVVGHQFPGGVALALETLQEAGLLTEAQAQANFNVIAQHQSPGAVAFALKKLQEAGLLTEEQAQVNRDALAGHQNPRAVSMLLQYLMRARLMEETPEMGQAQFERLISYSNILLSGATNNLWSQIPEHAFTEATWTRMCQICRANQINPTAGCIQLARYINQELLGIVEGQVEVFNRGQSTHTASVHQTVSESTTVKSVNCCKFEVT